jgi:hypothetical protein
MDTGIDLSVDGYPLDPADPDVKYHRELGYWLETGNRSSSPVALREGPPEEWWRWIQSILRRLDWLGRNAELLPERDRWTSALAHLFTLLLNKVRFSGQSKKLPEETVIAIALAIGPLEKLWPSIGNHDALALVHEYAKTNPRTARLREALHKMLRELAPTAQNYRTSSRELAWMLFLDDDDSDDGDPCWSAFARREISSLKPAQRKKWIRLLNLAPVNDKRPSESWEERLRKAVATIGSEDLGSHLLVWRGLFTSPEPVWLEFAGAVLLRLLIEMTALEPSGELIAATSAPAQAQWEGTRSLELWKQLLPRYTDVMFQNPACRGAIVALAAQPYAAEAPAVTSAMEELLKLGPVEPAAGIDGFELQGDQAQVRIDRYLRSMDAQAASQARDPLVYLLPERTEMARRELLQAIDRRIEWLSGRMPKRTELPRFFLAESNPQPVMEFARIAMWKSRLEQVRSELLRGGVAVDVQELAALLRKGSWAAYDRIVEYTSDHGYEAELTQAVREFYQTLHGSVADQTKRRQVGWWLWLENVTPIDAKECWSNAIRADLRAFLEPRRQAWRRLFQNVSFADTSKIPAKWIKAAKPLLAAVGEADFGAMVRAWMEPFRDTGRPLALTAPGRDALRLLIWYSSLCRPNPALDEALAWIGQAKWKNKKSAELLGRIVGPLTEVLCVRSPERAWEALDGLVQNRLLVDAQYREYAKYRELSATLGKQAREASPAKQADPAIEPRDVLRKLLKALPGAERAEMNDDHILVHGELDDYRVSFAGEVTRRDGRQVSIDLDQLPPAVRQTWQSSMDALDLRYGPFQPNPMRAALYVVLLAKDREFLKYFAGD